MNHTINILYLVNDAQRWTQNSQRTTAVGAYVGAQTQHALLLVV